VMPEVMPGERRKIERKKLSARLKLTTGIWNSLAP
jgi:hypothetical protein